MPLRLRGQVRLSLDRGREQAARLWPPWTESRRRLPEPGTLPRVSLRT